jgi:hypothetical protein
VNVAEGGANMRLGWVGSQPWEPPGPALWVRHGGQLTGEDETEGVAVAHDAAGTVYPDWMPPASRRG